MLLGFIAHFVVQIVAGRGLPLPLQLARQLPTNCSPDAEQERDRVRDRERGG